jgi:hypothetical protein
MTTQVALDAAVDAVRSDGVGKVAAVVEQVCRLAVAAGVAAGEVAWLVSELESSHPSEEQLGEAAVSVCGLQSCMGAVAHAVGGIAERGGPPEIAAAAGALDRVAAQLGDLQQRLQPCV